MAVGSGLDAQFSDEFIGIAAIPGAGQLNSGAGGIETVFTTLAISDGRLPPTINQDHSDDACDLDYVPNVMRKVRIEHAMTNSFGFGGTNASLILSRHHV